MRRVRLVAKRSNFLRRVCPSVCLSARVTSAGTGRYVVVVVKSVRKENPDFVKIVQKYRVILQEDVRLVWFVVTGDMKSPYQGKIDHVRVTLGERHGEFSVRLFLCKRQTQVPILCVR